jgi:hypothetical protein
MLSAPAPYVAALGARHAPLALLVEMRLQSATLYLCTAARRIQFGGHDYIGVGVLGGIERMLDAIGDAAPLRLSLAGASEDMRALALTEPVRGRLCIVRLAMLDADTHAVLGAPVKWTGQLDYLAYTEDGNTATVAVVAESAAATYARSKPRLQTDADHQRDNPGDTSRRHINAQAQRQDVWPAASFFHRKK